MKRTAYILGDKKRIGADKEFAKAERHLENFFFVVFNPKAHHATVLKTADYNEKEAAAIFKCYMRECDMVFVLNGYEQSAEAIEEYKEAELLGMPMSFQTWK